MASSGRWRLDDPTTWFRLNHVLGPSPLGNHGNSSQPTGAGYPEELQLRCYQTTQWVRTPDHWILNTEAQNPWALALRSPVSATASFAITAAVAGYKF